MLYLPKIRFYSPITAIMTSSRQFILGLLSHSPKQVSNKGTCRFPLSEIIGWERGGLATTSQPIVISPTCTYPGFANGIGHPAWQYTPLNLALIDRNAVSADSKSKPLPAQALPDDLSNESPTDHGEHQMSRFPNVPSRQLPLDNPFHHMIINNTVTVLRTVCSRRIKIDPGSPEWKWPTPVE